MQFIEPREPEREPGARTGAVRGLLRAGIVAAAVLALVLPGGPADAAQPQPPPGSSAGPAPPPAGRVAGAPAARPPSPAARARVAWEARGRPGTLVIVRANTVDLVVDGRLTRRLPRRPGDLTLTTLGRYLPASWLTIDGGTARLSAAVVLTPGVTLDVGGDVTALALAGGATAPEAASIHTGSGRLRLHGVTVTSADRASRQAMPPSPGRPSIVVQPGGRLEAVDTTFADLGTAQSGPSARADVHDRAGVQFGSGSSGSLARTSLLRNGTGLRLSESQNVRLDDVTISGSAGDGLVLRDDRGTVMRGIRTERNGGYGVRVSGTGADRPVTGITTAGNGKFGIVLVGATDTEVRGVSTSGDAAGGVQISRSRDVTVSGLTATDEPMGVFTHLGSTNTVLDRLAITDGRRGVVIEKTTKHLVVQASTIDGARVAGVTIGGTGVELRDLTVSDSRTGVRVERGAEGVTAVGLTLFGGEDGVVATAGTTGVVLQDLTAEGVENESVRSFSPDTRILGGTIRGGSTGIHVGAGGTISGTSISLADEGIRTGSRGPVRADVVTVDAVSVGINTEAGSPFLLTDSSVHALEAVRGDLDQRGVNDLSLPPLNLLGAIGIPLVVLALILELAHTARQHGTGESVRPRTPPAPVARPAQDRVFSNRRERIETNAAGSVSSPPSASSAIP